MKKIKLIKFLILFIIISYPVFSKVTPNIDAKYKIINVSSIKNKPILMYDHTELVGNNKYIYLFGSAVEKEYYPGVSDNIYDTLFTPVFFKFSYENGQLNYLWDKKYNTGVIDTAFPQSPFEGVSFKHYGRGIMYQNSLGGFDIISSASKLKDSLKTMIILSFDQDGNLISETNNTDTNLMLYNYQRQRNLSMPTYIKTKENKIYYLFQNGTLNNKEDSLNLYQGNWVALEFDSLGNYIEKHSLFSFFELANNNKFLPRQGREEFVSEKDITFSDKQDNIYIISNISYQQCIDSIDYYVYNYKDNLIIKLNDKLETEFYLFEKDITPDTTRDVIPLAAALDKDSNILISFMSVDSQKYIDDYQPHRDTLYYIAKLSGETGELIDLKNLDINIYGISSMNIKTTNDGYSYLYGSYSIIKGQSSYNVSTSYFAKIDDDLNVEFIQIPFFGVMKSVSDFIDLDPRRFALVGIMTSGGPIIFEFLDNSGISDENKQIKILQYPNPAVEQATINGTLDYVGDVSISVVDLSGNIIKTFYTYSSDIINYTFNVDDIPAGTYNVLLRYDNKYIIDKLVIAR